MAEQPPEAPEEQDPLPDGIAEGIECPICEEGFESPEELEKHMQEEHG